MRLLKDPVPCQKDPKLWGAAAAPSRQRGRFAHSKERHLRRSERWQWFLRQLASQTLRAPGHRGRHVPGLHVRRGHVLAHYGPYPCW